MTPRSKAIALVAMSFVILGASPECGGQQEYVVYRVPLAPVRGSLFPSPSLTVIDVTPAI